MKSDLTRQPCRRPDEAKKLGIDSTPLCDQWKLFRGALSLEEFKAAIEKELKPRGNNQ